MIELRIWAIQKYLWLNEYLFFYSKVRKFYKALIKNKDVLILDVGANKGQSIDFFRSIWPESVIHSFEPNVKLFKLLENKYNGSSKTVLNNIGISNISGELTFFENALDETSTFEKLNMDSSYLEYKSKILGLKSKDIIISQDKVPVSLLSDYINNNALKTIDLLKIDVEGHEFACLQGLFIKPISAKINYIQIEEHSDDMYQNKVDFEAIRVMLNINNYFEKIRFKHGFGDFYEVIFEYRNN